MYGDQCRIGDAPPLTLDDAEGVSLGSFEEVIVPLGAFLRTLYYRRRTIDALACWNGLPL